MERSLVRDTLVGLFVLAGLGAMAYLSISIGGYTWRNKGGLKLTANFQETGQLEVHAPVVIAGVRVGEVTDIRLEHEHFAAVVTMDLDPTLQLSSDTFASVVTAGVLGDRLIELSPGGDDRILKSGDRIQRTEKAMILEKVLGDVVYGLTKDSGSSKPAGGADSRPKSP